MKKNRELGIAFLISTVVVMGALLISGTFFTGYHLVDDHEFITIRNEIQNNGLWITIVDSLKNSFSIRFRPVYIFFRVLGTWMIGLHWQVWYTVKAVEIIISMVLLYWFARRMNANAFCAVMFSCISLCGTQAEIWCRLGPQESLGIMVLSVILWLSTRPRSLGRNFLLTALLLTLGGIKEAFVLIMPAVFFVAVWYEMRQRNENFTLKEIGRAIWKNKGYCIVSALGCICYLLTIVFYVGLNEIGYAGFPDGMSWKQYVWRFMAFFREDDQIGVYYGWIAIITVWTLLWTDYRRVFREFRKYFYAALILGFLIAGQIVLHITSGMIARYLIPWIVGICCYVFLFCFNALRKSRIARGGFYFLCSIMCVFALRWTVKPLAKFVETGDSAEFVIQVIEQNYQEGEKVATCLGETELDLGFNVYFYYESKISDVYVQDTEEKTVAVDRYFGEKGNISLEEADYLIVGNSETDEKAFFEESGLHKEDYRKSSLERYAVYQKIEGQSND